MDEFGLIRRLTGRVPGTAADVRIGIGDDAAAVAFPAGTDVLVSTDTMVGGRHFLPATMGMADIGYKAAVASISDIAAMGGEPRHVLVALGVSQEVGPDELDRVYDGIGDACRAFACAVVGGDVVATDGPLFVNTTVLGWVEAGRAIRRGGAQPGDVVFLTGEVGSAEAGLRDLLQPEMTAVVHPADRADVRQAHQRPTPQVAAGRIFAAEGATSCDDISDGLASELNEIADASGVRIRVDERRIPISTAARNIARQRGEDPLEYAWYGGEDYQLVGTASPFVFARILARCESIGVKVAQIGRVEAGDGVVADRLAGGIDIVLPRGYNHFPTDA
ncbi:MAG: thiamine-phosphate kinase [Alicyclobacillus sp.]|nr:thiamine-phosphate kinase [Alicyclobacillus sp.]